MSRSAPRGLTEVTERDPGLQTMAKTRREIVSSLPGPRAVPEILWAPATASFLTLLSGFLGLAAHQSWLFPSLAPSAFLIAGNPQQPNTRLYNVVAGHFLAIGAGCVSVLLLGATSAPSVMVSHSLAPVRIWASGLAILMTLAAQIPTRSFHPPAASTATLISLGAFNPTWGDARTIAFGVLILACAGEIFRRGRLAQPGQN